MLAENQQKKKKFKFDEVNADFCWCVGPENPQSFSDESYRNLLKNIFFYDPDLHDFNRDRFRIEFED